MERKKFKIAMLVFAIGAVLTGCETPAQKVERAETNVTEANRELKEAQDEYVLDIENYRKETDTKILANEKSMAEFEARIANEKKEARADYDKKIIALQQKNTDMKKKMDDYKADGKD